jgi:hypothetical protein
MKEIIIQFDDGKEIKRALEERNEQIKQRFLRYVSGTFTEQEIQELKTWEEKQKAAGKHYIFVGMQPFSFTNVELLDAKSVQNKLMKAVLELEQWQNAKETKDILTEAEFIGKEMAKIDAFFKQVEPVRQELIKQTNDVWQKITVTLPQWKQFIQDNGSEPLNWTNEQTIMHNCLAWKMAQPWQELKNMGVDKIILQGNKWFKPIAEILTDAYKDMKKAMKGQ